MSTGALICTHQTMFAFLRLSKVLKNKFCVLGLVHSAVVLLRLGSGYKVASFLCRFPSDQNTIEFFYVSIGWR